jgi:hypothetical protein
MNLLNTKWFRESDSMDSKDKSTFLFNLLYQGFSTFWYSRTPNLKLYPYTYHQIKIVPQCKLPNQNCSPMHTPKSKLYPCTYHQIKIVLLCVPPNQTCNPYAYPQIRLLSPLYTPQLKLYPKKLHLSGFFFILRTPVGSSRTPRGLFDYPWRTYPRFLPLIMTICKYAKI